MLDTAQDESLTGGAGDDTIVGTGSSDALVAGTGSQFLMGTGNDDRLIGGGGADTLVGGGNAETLVAGTGNQALYGDGNDEVLTGGAGLDTLYGGTGDDTLTAGTSSTVIYGGEGTDSIMLAEGSTTSLYPSNGAGTEMIYLPAGMALSDFTAVQGADGELTLQSKTGDTTAVINGFYGSQQKLWFLTDGSGAVHSLASWVDLQQQTGTGTVQEATGANQEVIGGSTGPAILVGGYQGDTLIGSSGQDTFDYSVGGRAEVISETAAVTSTSANVLQFGGSISPASISLSVANGGYLLLSIGNDGDSVAIAGFDPLNPLQLPIQSFTFADGTQLHPLQLLSDGDIAGSSGNITNADGSTTSYDFTPSQEQVYFAQKTNTSNQVTASRSVNSDGSQTALAFAYNADGSYSSTKVSTPAGGGGSTTQVDEFNTRGQWISSDVTKPDGSIENFTFAYHPDGTRTQTEVSTPAGGQSTTTVMVIDSQNDVLRSRK